MSFDRYSLPEDHETEYPYEYQNALIDMIRQSGKIVGFCTGKVDHDYKKAYQKGEGIDTLLLETDRALFIWEAYGDCCSFTWIENLEKPVGLKGSELLAIEDRKLRQFDRYSEPDPDYPEEPPQIIGDFKVYSKVFKTTAGFVDVEFRNSSNGSYGGNLQLRSILVDGRVVADYDAFMAAIAPKEAEGPKEVK